MKKAILFFLFIMTCAARSEVHQVTPLQTINTNSDESHAFLNSTEDMLIFSVKRDGNFDFMACNYSFGQIISSPVELSKTELFADFRVNNEGEDFSGRFTLNNRRFYFASGIRNGTQGGLDIWFTKNTFDEWDEINNLGPQFNSKNDDYEPTFSPDGNRMYFTSNRPGGAGGTDIWYSDYDSFNEKWQAPVNLKEINTPGNESSPFLASDGKTLFFVSDNMQNSLGGKDIYYIRLLEGGYSDIHTLPSPINSAGNETSVSFSRDGSVCFVASDRGGNSDIYKINLVPIFSSPITLQLSAYDNETGSPVPVKFTGKLGTKLLFGKRAEKTEILIEEADFYGKSYIDVEISAENPLFPEHSKEIRLYNNQSQNNVVVSFAMSEEGGEIKLDKLDVPYADGGFTVTTDLGTVTQIEAFETTSSSMKPILNYIFFNENSFAIPRRYNQTPLIGGMPFSEEALSNLDNMDVYYNVLNVLGYRMQNNPGSEITLSGYNSNSGKEQNNRKLSEKRAQSVADYLQNVWNIDSDRIDIESGNLPEFASSSRTEEGRAENRRVEIITENRELLKPIFINWKAFKSEPASAKINLYTTFHKTEGRWNLKISSRGNVIDEYSGSNSGRQEIYWNISEALTKLIDVPEKDTSETVAEGDKPEKEEKKGFFSRAVGAISDVAKSIGNSIKEYTQKQEEIDSEVAGQQIAEDEKSTDIVFELSVTDKNTGQTVIKNKSVKFNRKSINEVANPVRYDKYSFISFDFGKSEPTEKHNEVLEFVNGVIKPTSNIKVTGYADRIGDEKVNLNLSKKRADGIANSIKSENITVEAVGERILLFDNGLPEGRMYSRTIIAEIETPFEIIQDK